MVLPVCVKASGKWPIGRLAWIRGETSQAMEILSLNSGHQNWGELSLCVWFLVWIRMSVLGLPIQMHLWKVDLWTRWDLKRQYNYLDVLLTRYITQRNTPNMGKTGSPRKNHHRSLRCIEIYRSTGEKAWSKRVTCGSRLRMWLSHTIQVMCSGKNWNLNVSITYNFTPNMEMQQTCH